MTQIRAQDAEIHAITAEVLARFAETPDPRLRELIQALVRHLHAFVREAEPSFAEWQAAIAYLTRTGQLCSANRQEFILLSDVLGVSMLVDAINHRAQGGATETTVLGPFHAADAPAAPNGADISGGMAGEALLVEGVVRAAGGAALAGALVEVWQADAEGFYDVQRAELAGHALRANFRTDGAGRFHFWSIMPAPYPIPDDGPVGALLAATGRHPFRPAHIHFMISAPGYETLVTHIFAADSPYLDSDAVFGVKPSLIRDFTRHPAGVAPDGTRMAAPWRHMAQDFSLKPEA
jgi:hydroxyquinol 1,2-dioxygenase